MRVFGWSAFVYNESPESKFHSTGQPCIMLGCSDYEVYTVELVVSKRTTNSVHVTFDESSFSGLNQPDYDSSTGESESWDNEVSKNSFECEAFSILTPILSPQILKIPRKILPQMIMTLMNTQTTTSKQAIKIQLKFQHRENRLETKRRLNIM